MRTLELFAGSRSFTKVAQARGHETFSSDWETFDSIDLVQDIRKIRKQDVPFRPDVVWASPHYYAKQFTREV